MLGVRPTGTMPLGAAYYPPNSTNAVALVARSLAASLARGTQSARTALLGKAASTTQARAQLGGNAQLSARGNSLSASQAKSVGSFLAVLTGKSAGKSFAKATQSARAILLARSYAATRSGANMARSTFLTAFSMSAVAIRGTTRGVTSLIGRSAAASFGRIVPPGSVALLARSFAKVFMRGPVHGTTMLTVKSTAQSKSSAKLAGHVGLAAFSKTTSQIASRVTAVLYLPISGASSFSASFARSALPNLIAVVTDLARKIAGKYGIAAIQGKYGITNITGSSMTATADAISDFVCGDTWEISATLYNASGSPLDLTGAQSIVWTLDDISASTNVLTLSLNSGISLSGQPTSGQVLIKPTPTQTASLIPMTSYRQQCTVVLADGTKTTQFIGAITPLPSNK